MIKIRNGNGYAAFVVLSVVAVIFIAYYVMIEPHSIIFEKFMNNSDVITLNQTQCENRNLYWEDMQCSKLPSRARSLLFTQRRAWLVAPFILILSLIVWYFTVIGRRDPRDYDLVRWK